MTSIFLSISVHKNTYSQIPKPTYFAYFYHFSFYTYDFLKLILPNFSFPIFHFVTLENNTVPINRPSLKAKNVNKLHFLKKKFGKVNSCYFPLWWPVKDIKLYFLTKLKRKNVLKSELFFLKVKKIKRVKKKKKKKTDFLSIFFVG
jgi:hypothetical protein